MEFDLVRVLFGLFIATISSISISIYVIIQKIIMFDSDRVKYSSYKIILFHGFIDIIQLCVCICYGILAIIGSSINKWIEKFLGFQFSFCWYNIGSLTVLLAINRLALLYFDGRAEHFFNSRKTSVIIFITVAFSSIFSLIWLTPFATYGFDAQNLMWTYDSFNFMPICDHIYTLATSLVSTICNILLLKVVFGRKASNELNKNCKRLTLQTIINGTYTVFVSTYILFIRPNYVPYTAVYNGIDILLSVLWSGKNPILHLFFIQFIREKFLENIQNSKTCFSRNN